MPLRRSGQAPAFSARDDAGTTPFDAADCPVFQVALSTAPRALWSAEERGLSAADLAMHVVLPEVDGRIFLGAVSFKAPQPRDPDLQFSRQIHAPDPERIAAAVARIRAWHRLRDAPRRAALMIRPCSRFRLSRRMDQSSFSGPYARRTRTR